jgi:hypothetical protein
VLGNRHQELIRMKITYVYTVDSPLILPLTAPPR